MMMRYTNLCFIIIIIIIIIIITIGRVISGISDLVHFENIRTITTYNQNINYKKYVKTLIQNTYF